MEARLQKWGNSVGIRIPSSILKSLDLKTDDLLEIVEEEDKIVISKSKKKKISLKELFDKYDGSASKDFEWDEARGKEIW